MPAFTNYRQPKQYESDSDSEHSDCNSGAGSEDEFLFGEQHPGSVRDANSTGQTLQLCSVVPVMPGNRRKPVKRTKEDIEKMIDGLTRIKISDDELIDTPSEMTVPLMDHQREGVAWMVRGERNKTRRGGLLGDDMGMGKTLQSLALMVANKPKPGHSHATLVVAPASTVYQWQKEAQKLFKDGTFNRIIVYHGPNRKKLADSFADCDLVITTFTIVSREWNLPKTDKMFNLDARERKQRDRDVQELANSPLFQTSWRRLIIDEAHGLKNRETIKSMACCDLVARYRWLLSGTPIQNDLTDMYSILRFLRIQPYCQIASFETLKYRPDGGLDTVKKYLEALMIRHTKASQKKTPLLELPPRYTYIHRLAMSPVERVCYSALIKQGSYYTSSISKNAQTALFNMLRYLRQASSHPQVANFPLGDMTQFLKPDVHLTVDLKTHVNTMLLHMEDGTDEPPLCGSGSGAQCGYCASKVDFSQEVAVHQCGGYICDECSKGDLIDNPCSECLVDQPTPDAEVLTTSPLSGQESVNLDETTARWIKDHYLHMDNPCASAKMYKILHILQEVDKNNPTDKTVIFSQHITMLKLLSSFLAANGFSNAVYYGGLTVHDRIKVLKGFSSNANMRVLLVSKMAGNVGINLTAANHVIIESMWWNPTVDDQAADRVYRIGQTKPVHVHTLILQNTVDEMVFNIRESKRKIINDVVGGDTAAKSDELTYEEKMSIISSTFD
ncbi:hypothetical protein IW136_000166 [Coemansia sp. RSA 678]|nr:hypothetical protein IW136_000166 [Coemansia sp. RSA 678]